MMSQLFDNIRVLHIESTDVCQAACPSCARETDHTFSKDQRHWLSVTDIKNILPEYIIGRLDKMFMCGNYGDPAANVYSANIFSYFRSINSDITLGMNTNGGLQNSNWWIQLAKILHKPTDYVVFSIDGLVDTNHIYRKNVNWDYVMRNAESFINAGGNAQWDMLVYEHNEHQVDSCEQLARDMGFKWFRAKVSKRIPTVEWLKPPRTWTRPLINQGPIQCFREVEQSIYLSARGVLHPCCWLGTGDVTIDQYPTLRANWDTDSCNPVCKKTCSSNNNMSNFTSQWQRNTQLC